MQKGAKEFIDEIGSNAELRRQMYKQSAEIVQALAKQHGFEFSSQEMHDALHERLGITPAAPASETESSNCVVVVVAAAARNK